MGIHEACEQMEMGLRREAGLSRTYTKTGKKGAVDHDMTMQCLARATSTRSNAQAETKSTTSYYLFFLGLGIRKVLKAPGCCLLLTGLPGSSLVNF